MEPLYVIATAVTATLVALLLLRVVLRRPPARPRVPYTKRASLLTPAEQRFYRVLLRAVPQGMTAFVKVRLLDAVNVPDGAWRKYGAPASGMHLDFVLDTSRQRRKPCH
jgi:hypothetical protein